MDKSHQNEREEKMTSGAIEDLLRPTVFGQRK